MRTDVYIKLKEIVKKHGPSESGGICQDLLALSFAESKWKKLEVHDVEGIDILYEGDLGKFAIEVKTTTREEISVGEKDCQGLKKAEKEGYIPILAVIKLDVFDEWIFYKTNNMKPKSNLSVNSIYTHDKLKRSEKIINETFENLLEEHYKNLYDNGRRYIISLLKMRGIKTGKLNKYE